MPFGFERISGVLEKQDEDRAFNVPAPSFSPPPIQGAAPSLLDMAGTYDAIRQQEVTNRPEPVDIKSQDTVAALEGFKKAVERDAVPDELKQSPYLFLPATSYQIWPDADPDAKVDFLNKLRWLESEKGKEVIQEAVRKLDVESEERRKEIEEYNRELLLQKLEEEHFYEHPLVTATAGIRHSAFGSALLSTISNVKKILGDYYDEEGRRKDFTAEELLIAAEEMGKTKQLPFLPRLLIQTVPHYLYNLPFYLAFAKGGILLAGGSELLGYLMTRPSEREMSKADLTKRVADLVAAQVIFNHVPFKYKFSRTAPSVTKALLKRLSRAGLLTAELSGWDYGSTEAAAYLAEKAGIDPEKVERWRQRNLPSLDSLMENMVMFSIIEVATGARDYIRGAQARSLIRHGIPKEDALRIVDRMSLGTGSPMERQRLREMGGMYSYFRKIGIPQDIVNKCLTGDRRLSRYIAKVHLLENMAEALAEQNAPFDKIQSILKRAAHVRTGKHVPSAEEIARAYATLNADPSWSDEMLLRNYRQKIRLVHPDVNPGGSHEAAQKIINAWEAIQAIRNKLAVPPEIKDLPLKELATYAYVLKQKGYFHPSTEAAREAFWDIVRQKATHESRQWLEELIKAERRGRYETQIVKANLARAAASRKLPAGTEGRGEGGGERGGLRAREKIAEASGIPQETITEVTPESQKMAKGVVGHSYRAVSEGINLTGADPLAVTREAIARITTKTKKSVPLKLVVEDDNGEIIHIRDFLIEKRKRGEISPEEYENALRVIRGEIGKSLSKNIVIDPIDVLLIDPSADVDSYVKEAETKRTDLEEIKSLAEQTLGKLAEKHGLDFELEWKRFPAKVEKTADDNISKAEVILADVNSRSAKDDGRLVARFSLLATHEQVVHELAHAAYALHPDENFKQEIIEQARRLMAEKAGVAPGQISDRVAEEVIAEAVVNELGLRVDVSEKRALGLSKEHIDRLFQDIGGIDAVEKLVAGEARPSVTAAATAKEQPQTEKRIEGKESSQEARLLSKKEYKKDPNLAQEIKRLLSIKSEPGYEEDAKTAYKLGRAIERRQQLKKKEEELRKLAEQFIASKERDLDKWRKKAEAIERRYLEAKAKGRERERALRESAAQKREELKQRYGERIAELKEQYEKAKKKVRQRYEEKIEKILSAETEKEWTRAESVKDVVDWLRAFLPPSERGKFVTAIKGIALAKTPDTIRKLREKAIERIIAAEEEAQRRVALRHTKKLVKAIRKTGIERFRPALRDLLYSFFARYDPSVLSARKRAKLEKLKKLWDERINAQIEEAEKNDEFFLPPYLIEEVQRLDKTPISSLNREEVEKINTFLESIIQQQKLGDKINRRLKEAKALKAAQRIYKEIKELPPISKAEKYGAVSGETARTKAVHAYLSTHLPPHHFLEAIGRGEVPTLLKLIDEMIIEAPRKREAIRKHVAERMAETLSGVHQMGYETRRFSHHSPRLMSLIKKIETTLKGVPIVDYVDFTFHGEGRERHVKLSPYSMLSLYMGLHDPECRRSLLSDKGGFVFADARTMAPVRMTEDDAIRIIEYVETHKGLKKIAGTLREIFDWFADIGNPLALRMFGAEIFGRKGYYWPKTTLTLYRQTAKGMGEELLGFMRFNELTLNSLSFTKRRTKAMEPLILFEAPQLLGRYMNAFAEWYAFAEIAAALKRILRQRWKDPTNNRTTSLGDIIQQKFGNEAWRALIDFINRPAEILLNVDPFERKMDTLINRIGKGYLSFNVGVSLIQPISYIYALEDIPFHIWLHNLFRPPASVEDMARASPVLYERFVHRRVDFVTGELGQLFSSFGALAYSPEEQIGVGSRQMSLIVKGDRQAIGRIYNCYRDILEIETGLPKDDAAVKEAAGRLTERAIARHQPSGDMMQRPIAAKARTWYRPLMFFTAQVGKIGGQTYLHLMKATHRPRKYSKKAMRFFAILFAGAAMKTFLDIFRSWWRGRYINKKEKGTEVLKDFATYFLMNIAGYIPGVARLVPQMILGRRTYPIGYPFVSDLARAQELISTVYKTKDPAKKVYYAGQAAISISRLFGWRYANLIRDFPFAAAKRAVYVSSEEKKKNIGKKSVFDAEKEELRRWREIEKYYLGQ